MTDLGKNHSGPKESDNRDKSLHGLIVALAMAGTIAGSVILFAYASSDGPLPDETASTVNELEQQPDPEPVIVEKVVDEPMYAEKSITSMALLMWKSWYIPTLQLKPKRKSRRTLKKNQLTRTKLRMSLNAQLPYNLTSKKKKMMTCQTSRNSMT